MKKYLLTIAYDGTDFFGWQKQAKGRTVQQCLEEALSLLLKTNITCIGASRTDSGVHALCQKVVFSADTQIPVEKMHLALASFLPKDISVLYAEIVSDDFNPRFNAKWKVYEYKIWNSNVRNPLLRNYSEFVFEKLNIDEMNKAAKAFIGTHDFKGFCSSHSSAKTTVRTIYSLDVVKSGNEVVIRVCGNGFLYNMVRIIAGTLIYTGIGKISSKDIPEIIASGKRELAGKTAGASGLCLTKISFEDYFC